MTRINQCRVRELKSWRVEEFEGSGTLQLLNSRTLELFNYGGGY